MALNPYGVFDPRHAEFEQREDIKRQLAEQERLIGDQADSLDALAQPQRERDAIRNAAAQELRKRWIREAPANVRAATTAQAQLSMKQLPPSRRGAWLAIGSFAMCFPGSFIVAALISERNDAPMFVIFFLMLCGIGVIAGIVWQVRLNQGFRRPSDEVIYRSAALQRVVDEYLDLRRADAIANKETCECPFCQETIRIGVKKCRHCGELL